MEMWRCPVCGGALREEEKRLACPAGHSFDLARQGYVNLMPTGGSGGKRHGDDGPMVRSRTAFLEKGYYQPIRAAVVGALARALPDGGDVLDAGCGEGWYTAAMAALPGVTVRGVDISREAVKVCARRGIPCAVASSSRLPLGDGSQRAVCALFAPVEAAEFRRVLAPGGVLLRAVPLERHLWSLKAAVYDAPYENEPPETEVPGFTLLSREDVTAVVELPSPEDIQNLFRMTPYWYKTGRADQEKLLRLTRLTAELSVCVTVSRAEP